MIIVLNTKSNFLDLIAKKETGVNRSYLLNSNFNNKLDKIVFVSNYLKTNRGIIPFIEVKYDFGRRNKRIEIVFLESTKISICKITKINEFDKDYFELLSLINDMQNHNVISNYKLNGVLIFMSEYNTDIVEAFLLKQEIHFEHMNIETLK
jgi:hypothetical protein